MPVYDGNSDTPDTPNAPNTPSGGYPAYQGDPNDPRYQQYQQYPGYQPAPWQAEAGTSPAGSAPPRRFGRVGVVPWSFGQTLWGTAVTLVPWVAIIVLSLGVSSTTGAASKAASHSLPRIEDVISGIIVLLFTAIVEGAFLLAPAWYALWRRKPGLTVRDGLRALGFRKAPLLPAIGWVLLGIFVVLIAEWLYSDIIQIFHLNLQTNATTLQQEAQSEPVTILFTLFGAVFVAPFCEEIFFRGYMFAGFLRGMPMVFAALLSALLFGIAHGDVGSFVPLYVIGVMLAIIRWRTGSIWPGMALHGLNNAIAAIVVIGTILPALR